MCGQKWKTRKHFLSDSNISLIGYQSRFDELELGIILFNHTCKTTLSIYAKFFTDLYKGEIFPDRKTGSEECSGFCLNESNLSPCPAKCECAYIREVLQIIKKWPKHKEPIQSA
jgi:hypothetical protein